MVKHASEWQLQEAKQCFSEVMRCADKMGPQKITKNGLESAWLISAKDYHRLLKKKKNLIDLFQKSPHRDIEISFERRKDLPRTIDL